jgi:hypothetical protein
MLTYLKLSGKPVGLLINFNVPVLKEGVKRILNPAVVKGERSSSDPACSAVPSVEDTNSFADSPLPEE